MMTNLNIAAVAKAAGVHRSTVSRAFSRPDAVNAQTREHILRVAEELGYTMSPLAQALRSKTSPFIPLIVPNLINPFYAELATTMTQAAGERGYQLVLCITNGDNERTARYLTAMQTLYAPFGIIAPSTRVDLDTLTQFGFGNRVVVIDRVDQHATVPSITVDNRRGIQLAFDHLRSLGHRRIGYVSGISGIHTAHERSTRTASSPRVTRSSWTAAPTPRRASGRPPVPRHDRPADGDHRSERHDGVRADLHSRRPGPEHPHGRLGCRFRRTRLSAHYNPVLTTVCQPIADMGNIAIDLAEKKAADGSVDHVVLTPELLVRASTAGPPA